MKPVVITLLLALSCAPATAQDSLTAEAFEAYVTGRTLIYGDSAGDYGGEDYLDGRRVRWSFLDGHCIEGRWYPAGEDICFTYEGEPNPQCWRFSMGDDGLIARFSEGGALFDGYYARESDAPLLCYGPDVGV